MEIKMNTFTLTVNQIKEIFEAGSNRELEAFPFESLALILQEYMNEGVSVHSSAYKHMTEVLEIMEI
jgi:hypothetical protein